MLNQMWQILFLCALCIGSVFSARILAAVSTPSYSHQVFYRPIWKELARRGHDLTLMTTDPMHDPTLNITEIDWSFSYKIWKEYNITNLFNANRYNPINMFKDFSVILERIMISQLEHPKVQNLLTNKSEKFDLFIVEYLYPGTFGFHHVFKCPYIGGVSMELPTFVHNSLGNPIHPILYPDIMLSSEDNLGFFERCISFVMAAVAQVLDPTTLLYVNHTLLQKYFGQDFPELSQIAKNVSLVLLNVDPVFYRRPLGPAVIPIGGGTHLEAPKPLSSELKEFLDSAKDGVIYFSLGTNVNETDVNPIMRKAFLNTFKKMPYKVLWKFGVDIPNISPNVKIVKWMNQLDVLRHPNIKCFITQGGLQSTEEAIFSNVPMIGIPFLGDQESNVKKVERRGMGIALDRNTLTEEQLTNVIYEVIKNPNYKNKVKEWSTLSKDQPFTGLEKAIWWIEYVLRHKGAKHLKNHAVDVPVYQSLMIDVLIFFAVALYLIIKILIFVFKFIFTRLIWSKEKLKSD